MGFSLKPGNLRSVPTTHRKLEATYCREKTVRATGEPSKASWVDDAVGVKLVAS